MSTFPDQFRLDGRTALVTGSGRGLGWQMARGLAEAGARVLLHGRSAERLAPRLAELRQAGFPADGLAFDMADRTAMREAVAKAGPIDVLVHNVGERDRRPFAEISSEDFARLVDVDLSAAPELVEASLRIGRVAEARSAAEAFEARATRKGQPWSLARAARVRGLLASDHAIDRPFADALALHARTVDAFELACTHLAYGARLRRSRRRIDARHQLRIALTIFERLGADPWSEATRTELLSSGETARKREYSMINALTRQEFHIARVMAEGRTTREVAAALFLSPKTIEYHLRSVYRKLGVNNRADLASALAAPADDTAAAVRD